MRPITTGGGSLKEIERSKYYWERHRQERATRQRAARQRRKGQKITQLEEHLTFRRTGRPPKRILQERRRYRVKHEKARSVAFYEELGYPEYAGKFKPFKIPEGKEVESIEKTDKGLAITFTEVQKGLAQTILDWGALPTLGLAPTPEFMQPVTPEQHPERFFAGAIARFESLIYGVGRLAGFETPSVPSTLTTEYGWEYMMGVGWSSLLMGEVFGKVISKAASPIRRHAQEYLTRQYLAKGPLEWKGAKEALVMKLTGTTPYVARQVVSVPSPHTPQAAIRAYEAWSLSGPRSGLLGVGGVTGTSKRVSQWLAEKWIKRITGGLSYALVQEELSKTTTDIPYLPKYAPLTKTPSKLPPILGILATFGVQAFPFTAEKSKVKTRRKAIAIPDISNITIEIPNVISDVATKTETKTKTVLGLQLKSLTTPTLKQRIPRVPSFPPQTPKPGKPPVFKLPKLKGLKAKKKLRLFDERWFKKKHPLATSKKMKELIGL